MVKCPWLTVAQLLLLAQSGKQYCPSPLILYIMSKWVFSDITACFWLLKTKFLVLKAKKWFSASGHVQVKQSFSHPGEILPEADSKIGIAVKYPFITLSEVASASWRIFKNFLYLIKRSDNGLVSDGNLCKVVRLPHFPGHAGNRKRLFFVRPKLQDMSIS